MYGVAFHFSTHYVTKTTILAISITGTYTPAPGFVLRSLTMVAPCGIVLVFAPWIVVN
jgi:hypothetical protein